MIVYQTDLHDVSSGQLSNFCVGWKNPLRGDTLLKILENSYRRELALDNEKQQVVGFVNSLSDDIHFAFIPMMEVLPEYQNKGIGKRIM